MISVYIAIGLTGLLALLLTAIGAEAGLLLIATFLAAVSAMSVPLRGKDRLQLLAYSLATLLPGFLFLATEQTLTDDQGITQLIALKISEALVGVMSVSLLSRSQTNVVPSQFINAAPLATVGLFFVAIPELGDLLPLLCGIFFAGLASLKFNAGRTLVSSQWKAAVAVTLGTLLISGAWTSLVGTVTAQIENWLYNSSVSAVRGYPRGNVLGTVAPEFHIDPTGSALRIRCTQIPGYLRGRVYDTYEDGRWFVAAEAQKGRRRFQDTFEYLPELQNGPEPSDQKSFFTFFDAPAIKDCEEMEIWNDPMRGKMYFAPLGTVALAVPGGRPQFDSHDVIRDGISTRQSYTLYFRNERPKQPLAPSDRLTLLQPLSQRTVNLTEIASSISQTDVRTEIRLQAVEDFFKSNFEYNDEGRIMPVGTEDRLGWFLKHRPAAHCEYFATAAVAILRELDVPSRYVVGYVAERPGDDDEIWFAPNASAHAWVEAYDDQTERWVVVEPTPGRFFDRSQKDTSRNSKRSSDRATARSGRENEDESLAMHQNNESQGNWLQRMLSRQSSSVTRAVSIVGIVALCFLGIVIVRTRNKVELSAEVATMHRLERSIARFGAARNSSQTLHQFSESVRFICNQHQWNSEQEILTEAARLVEDYAARRYSGNSHDWHSWVSAAEELIATARRVRKRKPVLSDVS